MDVAWNRRGLMAAGLALSAAPAWSAEPGQPEHIPLWPGLAPGGDKVRVVERLDPFVLPDGTIDNSVVGVTRPTLTIYPAKGAAPSNLAVLVIPGGGFRKVVADKEGRAIARWLAGEGITAGVLVYRLPGDGDTRAT